MKEPQGKPRAAEGQTRGIQETSHRLELPGVLRPRSSQGAGLGSPHRQPTLVERSELQTGPPASGSKTQVPRA